ncbi:hypothetical protein [Arsenophonus endosymbiont of Aleurodicus floccissimus]
MAILITSTRLLISPATLNLSAALMSCFNYDVLGDVHQPTLLND